MPRKVHFVSLGCAKNRVDTEVMLGVTDQRGLAITADPLEAEVIVVNTCGFIGPAKEESVNTILEMARYKAEGACEKLVVAGCLTQRYADEVGAEIPEIDYLLGSSDMLKLGPILDQDAERMQVGNPADYTMRAEDPRILTQMGHSAYLKIAEGCNRSCSFCAIPGFRGKQRSRPIADLVREATALVDAGVREICLISQDTIAYGRDREERPNLAGLAEALADIPDLEWLRLHYLYPEKLDPDLLSLMDQHPTVLPYVDMPFQHASNDMLRSMRRGHGGQRLRDTVDRLRQSVPELVLRTTFLVGHPGETDADFRELCDFLDYASPDHLGVFAYSHEEGTPAGDRDDLVPEEVVEERQRELLTRQREFNAARLRQKVGSEIEVLVDGLSEETDLLLEGRWWGQAPDVDGKITLANGAAQPGDFRRAIVTAASEYDLIADLLDEDGQRDTPADTSADDYA
ncbi:MAG TPA: 30S ribosomal protein S12 methylthiotransferase RimO [Deltaproteobacteria bacterium]|nr:30S ribosomal protein S12 methylthiotransferase RimO [Deltaproteobacteria bacterium]